MVDVSILMKTIERERETGCRKKGQTTKAAEDPRRLEDVGPGLVWQRGGGGQGQGRRGGPGG